MGKFLIKYGMYNLREIKRHRRIIISLLVLMAIVLILIIAYLINTIVLLHNVQEFNRQTIELGKILAKQDEEKAQKIKQEKDSKFLQMKDNIKYIYKSEIKRVFLTFDDGPSKNTESILNTLNNYGIKANFFVLGSKVEVMPEIVKNIYTQGHFIGNHGYSHNYSQIYSSAQSVLDEYNKTNQLVANAIGDSTYNSHLFRFPGGLAGGVYASIKNQAEQLLEQNYILNVDWNALTGDSEKSNPSQEYLMNNLQKTTYNKNSVILLMHDAAAKKITAETLPQVIEYLKQQGYEFKTFYDILGDTKSLDM